MRLHLIAAAAALALSSLAAHAVEWSDTAVSYRYGTQFQEPFNGKAVAKNIVNVTNALGTKTGTSFLSVDFLKSDQVDTKAQEAYLVYRYTFDLEKNTGMAFKQGPFRSLGLTLGFDWNTKNDPGYASRKRMLVWGGTVGVDVPGFLNAGFYLLNESNAPVGVASRYTYELHPMISANWGIPLGSSGFDFNGYMNWIAPKGKNEFGGATASEFNFDGWVLYDVGRPMGLGNNKLKAGLQYQYWHNKFGNLSTVPGSTARTPMVRVEYHF